MCNGGCPRGHFLLQGGDEWRRRRRNRHHVLPQIGDIESEKNHEYQHDGRPFPTLARLQALHGTVQGKRNHGNQNTGHKGIADPHQGIENKLIGIHMRYLTRPPRGMQDFTRDGNKNGGLSGPPFEVIPCVLFQGMALRVVRMSAFHSCAGVSALNSFSRFSGFWKAWERPLSSLR